MRKEEEGLESRQAGSGAAQVPVRETTLSRFVRRALLGMRYSEGRELLSPGSRERQPAASGAGFDVNSPDFASRVSSPPGGKPLDPATKQSMERGFGRSFDPVRVHDDTVADEMSEAIGAKAFTAGDHIFFARGAYDTRSRSGRQLLAHELTHTIQQEGAPAVQGRLEIGAVSDPAEREADRVADEVVRRSESSERMPKEVQAAAQGSEEASARMNADIARFRATHDPKALSALRERLGESGSRVVQRSPLGTIRRMARAPSQRERALQAVQMGDEEMINDVYEFFYPGMPKPDPHNPDAQRLAAAMVADAIEGSRMMDRVPRPGRPTPVWLLSQAVKAAWRIGRDEGIYIAVRNVVAARYRSHYEEMINDLPLSL